MATKMRITQHNARAGKHGVFSPKHNDRNFDVAQAPHIDSSKTPGNWTWHCFKNKAMTFDEAERRAYNLLFGETLKKQNARHIKAGHRNRIKSMDDYRSGRLTCPEEVIMLIGDRNHTVDAQTLSIVWTDYIVWQQKTYPQVKVLDAALHVDEQGAPHMHMRQVWIAHSADGDTVGQNKALQQMGVKRPDPDKKQDRHNNAKITFSRDCRQQFAAICKQHGLEIETTPKKTTESGRDLDDFQARQDIISEGIKSGLKTERESLQKEYKKACKEQETQLQETYAAKETQLQDAYNQAYATMHENIEKQLLDELQDREEELEARKRGLDERIAKMGTQEATAAENAAKALKIVAQAQDAYGDAQQFNENVQRKIAAVKKNAKDLQAGLASYAPDSPDTGGVER